MWWKACKFYEKKTVVGTRYTGAQCNEGDCINTVFKTDEAAEMTSNVANYSCAAADEEDGKDESGIAIIDSYIVKNLILWYIKPLISMKLY